MEVNALYEIIRFRVEFRDWYNTLLKVDSVDYGAAATAPADPEREWYTFVGWNTPFTSVTSDLVVTPVYADGKTINYTLTFTKSTDDSEITSTTIPIHMPVPPEVPGFTFVEWRVVGGSLVDEIEIQAVYESNTPTNTPAEVTIPGSKGTKLIREGNVYVLHEDKMYTLQGQIVQ